METLDMLVNRLKEGDATLHKPALEALRVQIRSSAVSLTSIPKALKFLRLRFPELVGIYNALPREEDQRFLADILAVVAMTADSAAPSGSSGSTSTEETIKDIIVPEPSIPQRATLYYHLRGQAQLVGLGDWGHEYVRHLGMELAEEFDEGHLQASTLLDLARAIAIFFLDHNGEPDACDLLYELGRLSWLIELGTAEGRDHERLCLYLLSCAPFEAEGDDRQAFQVAYQLYFNVGDFPHALALALRLGSTDLVKQVFSSCTDAMMRRQLAYMLARQQRALVDDLLSSALDISTTSKVSLGEKEKQQLQAILDNSHLNSHFHGLAKELEIVPPKTPDDVYKSHLPDSLRVPPMPSPKQNLAAALVNGLVNAGFGSDVLLTGPEVEEDPNRSWIYRVKDHGVVTTVASLGLLHIWEGSGEGAALGRLDGHLQSDNGLIKAGAALGVGLAHVGVRSEADTALALLREQLEQPSCDPLLKETSLMGLALAYSGAARRDVAEVATLLVADEDNLSVASMAALLIGHVFVGTGDGDMASIILQALMERDPKDLDKPMARFFTLALALLYLGRSEEEAQVVVETLQAIEHPLAREAEVLVKICSYAGSGNVLKIQELLRITSHRDNDTKEDSSSPTVPSNEGAAFAVVGVALIGMMEDIGKELSHRIFSHLMHQGSGVVRKAVPLAIGLLYTSHPAPAILDLLSKWSHDAEKAVAVSAIFALGLVAAGTNNAKVAQMLRQLAAYYQRDPDCLFVVRVAQGLVHAAKGTVTFSPVHSHRLLFSPQAVAGLLTTIICALNSQALLLERTSYYLYFLVLAMYPRFLVALSTEESIEGEGKSQQHPVTVRVGQAVDVVGQAGKPKTITGFQTHTTPVLLAYGERAEMATEEFLPLSPILENFVLVRRNPNWVAE